MKRTKLLVSLMMCVMCLSFLIVGVWAAAVSVNFNLNAGLKYYPEGVYVELSGQVYRGSSADNLTALTYDPRFTLSPTTNYDNSTGEPSGNFPIESWEIGAIPFIPTEKVVKIEVTITNHSDFTIAGIPDISIDKQLITEITGIAVTDNSTDLFSIESNTNVVYELILEVTSTTAINSSLSVSFDFANASVNYDYFTIDENNQITGLTQTYLDESPEVLVIPAYTQDGLNSLSIATGTPTDITFPNISTNTNILIFQEGFTNLSARVFSSNNIKSIVIPASLTRIGGYNSWAALEKAYFTIVEGWSTNYPPVTSTAEILSNPYTAASCLKSVSVYGMRKS